MAFSTFSHAPKLRDHFFWQAVAFAIRQSYQVLMQCKFILSGLILLMAYPSLSAAKTKFDLAYEFYKSGTPVEPEQMKSSTLSGKVVGTIDNPLAMNVDPNEVREVSGCIKVSSDAVVGTVLSVDMGKNPDCEKGPILSREEDGEMGVSYGSLHECYNPLTTLRARKAARSGQDYLVIYTSYATEGCVPAYNYFEQVIYYFPLTGQIPGFRFSPFSIQ